MDNNETRIHLWIPEEEVVRKDNNPTARSKDRGVVPSEHGKKLSVGLQNILTVYKKIQAGDSLGNEDLMIFKVILPEGEKIDNSERQKFLQNEGLTINAVKNRRSVIVSAKKSMFERLCSRVNSYKSSGRIKDFQFIDDFEPYTNMEKQSSSLRSAINNMVDRELSIDIQMMLVPNLNKVQNDVAIKKLTQKVVNINGELPTKPYLLTDGTPVIRAIIPMSAVNTISEDMAICRVEQTRFYSPLMPSSVNPFKSTVMLDDTIDIDSLPIVAVLDCGIKFSEELEQLVFEHWEPVGCKGGDCHHGTQVASKVIFSNIGEHYNQRKFTPRARVIDCAVMGNEPVSEDIMINRIQAAVKNYKEVTQIYNLSANTEQPIDGDEISIIGYELDSLMLNNGIQFVVSAGNHNLWETSDSLEEIIDDDDTRISAPADSMLGITVGAIVGCEHKDKLCIVNHITPYSRKGPGFSGFRKPDMVAYGAATSSKGVVHTDDYSMVIDKDGIFGWNAGTSFTAPVIAGDLAEISNLVPGRDILLAKALLYHGAQSIWTKKDLDDDEAEYIANLYGRGISNPYISKYSSPHRVTFVRTGELNRKTKERVKFFMPTVLATMKGNRKARVIVTCVSRPPIDRRKGPLYLGACITASLHKIDTKGQNKCSNPSIEEGRKKWDTCFHFEEYFSKFNPGDWEIWLELYSRWEVEKTQDIPYALAVTVEDVTKSFDIYNEIQLEAEGRFRPINTIRIPVNI